MAEANSYNLLEQDEYMNPTARFVSNIEEGLCDWKFRIYQEVDCDGMSTAGLTLYFDAYMNPMEYDEDRDEEVNGFNKIHKIRKSYTRIPNFDVIVDQLMNEYIYRLAVTPNLRFHVRENDRIFVLTDLSPERKSVIRSYLLELTLKLTFEDDEFADLVYVSCCRPAYEDAPFEDDCPDVIGSDGDCGDFDVSLSLLGSTLTATPADAPGTVTINWFYRENNSAPWSLLISNASSISLGAFGQYKAVATSQGCSVDDSYLYQNPCDSLTVEIIDNGVGLVAVGAGCDTPIYTWFLWDDGLEEWSEVYDGGPSYVPAVAGIYKVELAGCAECVAEDLIEWDGESACELTASLMYADNVLTAVHDPCEGGGGQTYQWFRDQGAGPVLVQSGTSPTYPVTESGLYEMYVTCNTSDCSGYARKVITCDDSCLLTAEVAIVDDVATVTLDGCEDDATFVWFRDTGSGYEESGTGNPFDLPGSGLYKVVITCGECSITKKFFHCVGVGISDCQKSQYFENFSGTELVITEFILPDPGVESVSYIRDHLHVFRAAQKVSFNIGFEITIVGNKIVLSWEAESEYIEVYWLGDCS